MSLTEKINADIKTCMLKKEEFRLGVIRMVKAELLNNQKTEKPAPEVDIVAGYHKKLAKSIELYKGNQEAIDKIQREMKIVEEYLPQKISLEDLQARIQKHKSLGNMGAIMKALKSEVDAEGKSFDGKAASEEVKKALGN